jgi:hypothetical protein
MRRKIAGRVPARSGQSRKSSKARKSTRKSRVVLDKYIQYDFGSLKKVGDCFVVAVPKNVEFRRSIQAKVKMAGHRYSQDHMGGKAKYLADRTPAGIEVWRVR